MTFHSVVTQDVDAGAAAVVDPVHDDPRRLQWDTALRAVYTIDGAAPVSGVGAR